MQHYKNKLQNKLKKIIKIKKNIYLFNSSKLTDTKKIWNINIIKKHRTYHPDDDHRQKTHPPPNPSITTFTPDTSHPHNNPPKHTHTLQQCEQNRYRPRAVGGRSRRRGARAAPPLGRPPNPLFSYQILISGEAPPDASAPRIIRPRHHAKSPVDAMTDPIGAAWGRGAEPPPRRVSDTTSKLDCWVGIDLCLEGGGIVYGIDDFFRVWGLF